MVVEVINHSVGGNGQGDPFPGTPGTSPSNGWGHPGGDAANPGSGGGGGVDSVVMVLMVIMVMEHTVEQVFNFLQHIDNPSSTVGFPDQVVVDIG